MPQQELPSQSAVSSALRSQGDRAPSAGTQPAPGDTVNLASGPTGVYFVTGPDSGVTYFEQNMNASTSGAGVGYRCGAEVPGRWFRLNAWVLPDVAYR